jgi:hypothetical protein
MHDGTIYILLTGLFQYPSMGILRVEKSNLSSPITPRQAAIPRSLFIELPYGITGFDSDGPLPAKRM